ncbi:MAG: hypothetical protein LBT12_07610 [Oscillospiraceae bacterium]|jgi:hypothetical protein|nr:hypothetical protein [Oscillospiraceae bacterium]
MTAANFTRYITEFGDSNPTREVDEESAKEVAGLLSGSLVYRLYEALFKMAYDMNTTTAHIAVLHESGNHFGLVYFILMLAESANVELPERYTETAVTAVLVPFLSSALAEDWLDFHEEYED